ncbi:MAG: hypothetical protein COA45_04225 [Zetaproteobacteria bacterium]|nr:MAG: hypothetical protein COA45_04225 [Zetaproteobacteria bacterium]
MFLSNHLFSLVDQDLGANTHKGFFESLAVTGYHDHFKKPLLSIDHTESASTSSVKNTNDMDWSKIRHITFLNETASDRKIVFQVTRPETKNIDELFHFFAEVTAHSHWITDFRDKVDYSAYILSNPNYLFFHGDGNCLLLSLLFSSMVENLTGYKLDVKFCRNDEGTFSHVYCCDEKRGRIYDIDQKSILNAHTLCADGEDIKPLYALIYWLLTHGGVLKYNQLRQSQSDDLLSSATVQYFKENFETRDPKKKSRIYQPDPVQEDFFEYWEKANKDLCETLNLKDDDYVWKKVFLNALHNQNLGAKKLMEDAFKPFSINIPASGHLSLGFTKELSAIEEIMELAHIFYGRTPMQIHIPASKTNVIDLFDMPWLILFSTKQEMVKINENVYTTTLTKCGNYRLIGMKTFEKIGLLDNKKWPFEVQIDAIQDDYFKIIYPANAFLFNSPYLETLFSGEVQTVQ